MKLSIQTDLSNAIIAIAGRWRTIIRSRNDSVEIDAYTTNAFMGVVLDAKYKDVIQVVLEGKEQKFVIEN
jgi:hypothetical protein